MNENRKTKIDISNRKFLGISKVNFSKHPEDKDWLIQTFEDPIRIPYPPGVSDVTNKGELNKQFCERLFRFLSAQGIPTHLIMSESRDSLIIQKLSMIPLYVVIRNRAAGSLLKGGKYQDREKLPKAVIEYYRAGDHEHKRLLSSNEVVNKAISTKKELDRIKSLAMNINDTVKSLLRNLEIELVDLRVKFGRKGEQIILGDVITPENCRLLDIYSDIMLDKREWMTGKNPELFERVYVETCGKIIAAVERHMDELNFLNLLVQQVKPRISAAEKKMEKIETIFKRIDQTLLRGGRA